MCSLRNNASHTKASSAPRDTRTTTPTEEDTEGWAVVAVVEVVGVEESERRCFLDSLLLVVSDVDDDETAVEEEEEEEEEGSGCFVHCKVNIPRAAADFNAFSFFVPDPDPATGPCPFPVVRAR